MANMLSMMKQAASMKKEMKKIQKQLESQSVTYENGGIEVVARGDMSIVSITISDETLADAKPERLNRLLVQVVNGALKSAKKEAAEKMAAAMGGAGGLGDMLGM